jgi:glycosyltransferase involved in cell wall biosynthesis
LKPYAGVGSYKQQSVHRSSGQKVTQYSGNPGDISAPDNYGGDIFSAVGRYAEKAARIAAAENFDVIHAHDWMTYPAGEAVSQQSHKPLIVHVHSTEFDRSGEHVNQNVYDIERAGMHAAAKVLTVSNFTKKTIVKHYGVPPEKVEVVHNAVEHNGDGLPHISLDKKDKIVLFLGRITMQKGPEYFLAAAKKVLQVVDNVKFIMAGNGDMMHRTIELAARMGIGHKVLFTGFLRGEDVDRAYQMADLYVMPSVSEPFGIASLEAMNQNVPILISKQSGKIGRAHV